MTPKGANRKVQVLFWRPRHCVGRGKLEAVLEGASKRLFTPYKVTLSEGLLCRNKICTQEWHTVYGGRQRKVRGRIGCRGSGGCRGDLTTLTGAGHSR